MTKQLTRSRDDRWVGGVCGGIARYTGVDANLIRLVTAVLTVLGVGTVIVAYVVAWLLMPQETTATAFTAAPTPPAPGPPSA